MHPQFQVLLTFVVSLFPLAVYCLILAGINRRERPLVARGVWDFAGVLAALSGILLWTGPVLLQHLMRRSFVENVAQDSPQPFEDFWTRWWLIWAAYYVLIVAGAALLLVLRGSVTVVYNVDAERLPGALVKTLHHLGFDIAQNQHHQVLIAPAKSLAPTGPAGAAGSATNDNGPQPFSAAVEFDVFPSMCHATLHWYTDDRKIRNEVELELPKQLADSRPADNPAALWFLSASTVLFGFIILGTAAYILGTLYPR
jgi:hypothetical protein